METRARVQRHCTEVRLKVYESFLYKFPRNYLLVCHQYLSRSLLLGTSCIELPACRRIAEESTSFPPSLIAILGLRCEQKTNVVGPGTTRINSFTSDKSDTYIYIHIIVPQNALGTRVLVLCKRLTLSVIHVVGVCARGRRRSASTGTFSCTYAVHVFIYILIFTLPAR